MSSLDAIPIAKRRQLAGVLGLFATLFVAVGAVASTGLGDGIALTFVVIAFVAALTLALMAWGVVSSIKDGDADRRLDDALTAALAEYGGTARLCDCGHAHDPDELHIVDEAAPSRTDAIVADCEHDGQGVDCAHACESCVLGSARSDVARRPRPGATRPPFPSPTR